MREIPFVPTEGRNYRVHYEQNGQLEYLFGTIEFSPDGTGGVMVTRAKDGQRIYVPRYVKIEEVRP